LKSIGAKNYFSNKQVFFNSSTGMRRKRRKFLNFSRKKRLFRVISIKRGRKEFHILEMPKMLNLQHDLDGLREDEKKR